MEVKIDPARIGGRASVSIKLESGEMITIAMRHERDDAQTIGSEKQALKKLAKAALERAIASWQD